MHVLSASLAEAENIQQDALLQFISSARLPGVKCWPSVANEEHFWSETKL